MSKLALARAGRQVGCCGGGGGLGLGSDGSLPPARSSAHATLTGRSGPGLCSLTGGGGGGCSPMMPGPRALAVTLSAECSSCVMGLSSSAERCRRKRGLRVGAGAVVTKGASLVSEDCRVNRARADETFLGGDILNSENKIHSLHQ
jgi:hypothetical protein